ncbi:lactate utilization protein C [Streptomyces sp. NBC_00233]|uniref:LutC/YkgG family protein n=1 Tax=Streptomyces sp. NBC_00233 TaxID=2975686 RepID=UPI00225BE851|nr:lactate utilization protein C [Streptomyces sp. NBC_00233]MCX5232838.1 lactate utilization protein C [Streptomyces sp. NBC_00233]
MTHHSRERVLGRIRQALADAPLASEPVRDYLVSRTPDDPATIVDLLHENLADYRAIVHRTTEDELPALLAELLGRHGARTVAIPPGLPAAWLSTAMAEQRHDEGTALTPRELDATDAVVTGCAVAIAETGTIVLDGGPGQGRRALTLVPDLHICIVLADQVVASVPQALPRLVPARPQTWISGPSATSDIELDRVEGVHGPRRLNVVIVSP